VTGRERITAAARGGEVDRRPTVSAFGAAPGDAIAVPLSEVSATIEKHPDSAVLCTVLSPLGRAIKNGVRIVQELHGDIDKGTELLVGLTKETREEMHGALEHGADGVFYVLDGAFPGVTTPMEYGGHFLELDRHLMTEVIDARFNVLFVCGEKDAYVDFVSDLPAHAFAWDPRSGISVEYVRSMRTGALAAAGDDADILLAITSNAEARA
jgi:hypothetical protein